MRPATHFSLALAFCCSVGWTLVGCEQFDNNAGLVRPATESARVPIADTVNDPALAPIPGAAGSPQGNNQTSSDTNTVLPAGDDTGVAGVPFSIRAALYEGGGADRPGAIVTLWSLPISCHDYQANQLPQGVSFVRVALPALPVSGAGSFRILMDGAGLGSDQAFVHLNTSVPKSFLATTGQVNVTKVTSGQWVEGTLSVTYDDGSPGTMTFAGASAAKFCSL